MAEVLPYIPFVAMSVVGSVAYFLKEKRKYKAIKTTIYTMIRKGIDDVDFDMLADGVAKLKDFDKRFMDITSGLPQKKIFEKVFRIGRQFKMDKFEALFNLPKEVVEDVESIRKYFTGTGRELRMDSALNSILEEEKKETVVITELKVKLQKIKRRQLAQNNTERTVIDNMNFTDKILELHKEYETLFIEQFENEKDLQNILQRGMKKQMIIKRMKQMQEKTETTTSLAC